MYRTLYSIHNQFIIYFYNTEIWQYLLDITWYIENEWVSTFKIIFVHVILVNLFYLKSNYQIYYW